MRLDGRHALVSGASRGIGAAAAVALAEAGATVHLAARSQEEIDALAQAIGDNGWNAHPLNLDVLDQVAVCRTLDRIPVIDILVNNAGTNRPKPMADVTIEDYDAIFDLNVKALFFLSQEIARRLIANGKSGSIIHMSSQMGHVGAENRTVYCASKHAVEGLTKAMAVELGRHSIRVNAIAPTFIETPMTSHYFTDSSFTAAVLSNIKLGRLGRVEDVMGSVVYLASDASALVTGTSLRIDGGWTAQ